MGKKLVPKEPKRTLLVEFDEKVYHSRLELFDDGRRKNEIVNKQTDAKITMTFDEKLLSAIQTGRETIRDGQIVKMGEERLANNMPLHDPSISMLIRAPHVRNMDGNDALKADLRAGSKKVIRKLADRFDRNTNKAIYDEIVSAEQAIDRSSMSIK